MVSLGVMLNVIGEEVGRIVAAAQAAEALGYERVWLPDEGCTPDIYVTLAAIAMATSRIAMGPGITNPYTRHPAVTAGAIATLDALSGGRAFLGLGPGGTLALSPLGLPRTAPLLRCRETIEVARRLWARTGPVTFAGRTVSLQGAHLPYGRPDIEVWMAGRGPRLLRMAGAAADGVLLLGIAKFLIPDALSRITAGFKEADPPRAETPRIALGLFLALDARQRDAIRPHFTYRIADSPDEVQQRMGPQAVATIRDVMRREGIAAAARHISDDMLENFVIMGSGPAQGAEVRSLITGHGVHEAVIVLPSLGDAETLLHDARAFILRALDEHSQRR